MIACGYRMTFGAMVLVSNACSSQVGKTANVSDDHLTCAAMISAADRLASDGKLSASEFPKDKALLASMTHFNAWAIPTGIKESEAFDIVAKKRAELLADLAPEEIGERAKACMEAS